MSNTTFEAATVETALEKAAAELGIAAADLEHEVVEEKHDFWGGGEGTVVIKAWPRAVAEPEHDAEEPIETAAAMTEAEDSGPRAAEEADQPAVEAAVRRTIGKKLRETR